MDEVPIQYFQSLIAIELAVTGALLFQIRYFAPRSEDAKLPDPRLRLAIAVVLAVTVFGSLEAMLHGGDRTAAAALLIGLAISLLPILLRVLPPLHRDATGRRPGVGVTVAGIGLYALLVAGAVALVVF